MNLINSMLYLILLFSSTSSNPIESPTNPLGNNSFIFLAIILLCLKDVEDCICEPECHCCDRRDGRDDRQVEIEREIELLRLMRREFDRDRRDYDYFPRYRPIRSQDFI